MALISVEHVTHSYGPHSVLRDVSFDVDRGERLAILGRNGSGKSTLARWMAGWQSPGPDAQAGATGVVRFEGQPWAQWSQADRVSRVQLTGQLPSQHMSGRAFSVIEEVAFGPENLCLAPADIQARVDQALALTGLAALADRDPFTLSGGEQQRLVVAATLALQPEVLILDEPFSNLDPASRDDLAAVLRDLPPHVTIILFETSPDRALSVAERFLWLSDGQIAAEGCARDVLLHPGLVGELGLPAVTHAVERSDWPTAAKAARPLTLAQAEQALKGV